MLAGVARPDGLRRTLEALGARVVAERSFADHHRYRIGDLAGLAAETPLWITTEKDALKIPRSWARDAVVLVLGIELAVADEEAVLDAIEARLDQRPRR
jgi:tetraacyldisaccharide 4'-kinase